MGTGEDILGLFTDEKKISDMRFTWSQLGSSLWSNTVHVTDSGGFVY